MLLVGLRSYAVGILWAIVLAACTGAIGASPERGTSSDDTTAADDGAEDGTVAPEGDDGAGGSPPSPAVPDPQVAFKPPRDSLQLLPFETRLGKLAHVVGVPTSDTIFAELVAQKRELGAYDYAQGIAPDLAWTAKRMATWMKGLRSVCDSQAMKRRYPTLTNELDDLVVRAFGRKATADDRADLASVPATLDATARYRAMCVGFLSSTEFLAP